VNFGEFLLFTDRGERLLDLVQTKAVELNPILPMKGSLIRRTDLFSV